jgi:hypothetical protein
MPRTSTSINYTSLEEPVDLSSYNRAISSWSDPHRPHHLIGSLEWVARGGWGVNPPGPTSASAPLHLRSSFVQSATSTPTTAMPIYDSNTPGDSHNETETNSSGQQSSDNATPITRTSGPSSPARDSSMASAEPSLSDFYTQFSYKERVSMLDKDRETKETGHFDNRTSYNPHASTQIIRVHDPDLQKVNNWIDSHSTDYDSMSVEESSYLASQKVSLIRANPVSHCEIAANTSILSSMAKATQEASQWIVPDNEPESLRSQYSSINRSLDSVMGLGGGGGSRFCFLNRDVRRGWSHDSVRLRL